MSAKTLFRSYGTFGSGVVQRSISTQFKEFNIKPTRYKYVVAYLDDHQGIIIRHSYIHTPSTHSPVVMSVTIVLLVGLMTLLFVANARRTKKVLPPGPPSLPLIGHLLVLPSQSNMLEKVQAWSRVYGEWKGVFPMG